MDKFYGTIIEESLEDKTVLGDMKILSTKVEPITEKHKTPWVNQWTLHKVEIEADISEHIARLLSQSIDNGHESSWYADFKNDTTHFIIFRDKVFKIDRTNIEEYKKVTEYGLTLGIPEYQLGFSK